MSGIINFSKYFCENADELSKHLNIPIVYNLEYGKTYIVFSAQDAVVQLLEFQQQHKTNYIIYQSENIESSFFKNLRYIELLKKNKVLFYSHFTAMKCLELYNIPTDGFFAWEYPVQMITTPRTVDLLFFGAMTQKRYDIMAVIQHKFADKCIMVVSDVFGADLDQLLRKTKRVINISAYPNSVLETHRINKCLAYGCKVISNRSADEKLDALYNGLIKFCGTSVSDYVRAVSGD